MVLDLGLPEDDGELQAGMRVRLLQTSPEAICLLNHWYHSPLSWQVVSARTPSHSNLQSRLITPYISPDRAVGSSEVVLLHPHVYPEVRVILDGESLDHVQSHHVAAFSRGLSMLLKHDVATREGVMPSQNLIDLLTQSLSISEASFSRTTTSVKDFREDLSKAWFRRLFESGEFFIANVVRQVCLDYRDVVPGELAFPQHGCTKKSVRRSGQTGGVYVLYCGDFAPRHYHSLFVLV
jgi:hypothetical protein